MLEDSGFMMVGDQLSSRALSILFQARFRASKFVKGWPFFDMQDAIGGVAPKRMILNTGEKLHVIQRRKFEREAHRHFIGVVEAYEAGVARVTGHVYTVDTVKSSF